MPNDVPIAAKPTKTIFDPFNSSATGHQRADSRLAGSTSWRESRNLKLRNQYISGTGGGKRVADTVGAGSEEFGQDGRLENGAWAPGAKGLRTAGQQSIWESMNAARPSKRAKLGLEEKPNSVVNPFTPFRKVDGTVRETSWTSHEDRQDYQVGIVTQHDFPSKEEADFPSIPPQIFRGLTIYINGSTAPLVSDHRLKYLLSSHGAQTSVALGRRSVTHVIVGKTTSAGGCGGGLAGSKIHKEITKVGGKGVKFVTAAWIVDSVKAGRRLPETRYQGLHLASRGVDSVANMFSKQSSTGQDEKSAKSISGEHQSTREAEKSPDDTFSKRTSTTTGREKSTKDVG